MPRLRARREGGYGDRKRAVPRDALIDCGRFVPSAFQAQEPTALFEVLTKSTAWIDQNLKLRDYDATQMIMHYVLISQDEPRVMVYTRGDDGPLTCARPCC